MEVVQAKEAEPEVQEEPAQKAQPDDETAADEGLEPAFDTDEPPATANGQQHEPSTAELELTEQAEDAAAEEMQQEDAEPPAEEAQPVEQIEDQPAHEQAADGQEMTGEDTAAGVDEQDALQEDNQEAQEMVNL